MSLSSKPAADTSGRRKELYSLLGDLPDRSRRISARTLSTEERPGYMLEKLVLDLNGIEPVPAYFVKPKNLKGKAPVVLYHHAHGGDYRLGKDELLIGRKAIHNPPYAELLTSMGYCGLCADTWVFGERATRTELETFKHMLWQGQVLWGMMIYDSLRAVDYLTTRPEVDTSRIGTAGLSMGSTMAWWLGALDERIKVTVDICCLTDFQALIATNNLKGHGVYYYVPSLLKHFTTAQINALIAPRAHLSLAGNLDALTPPAGLDRVDAELRKVYAAAGHPDRWRLFRQEVGHQETPEMRIEIVTFLKKHL
jgi:dienelactone hydrolase